MLTLEIPANLTPTEISAYAEGYLKASHDWAVWKDGEQLIGGGIYNLNDVKKAIADAVSCALPDALLKQRETK